MHDAQFSGSTGVNDDSGHIDVVLMGTSDRNTRIEGCEFLRSRRGP